MNEPVVWIIDAEQWPRACLRAELIERGYYAAGYVELGEVLSALRRRGNPRPAVIVFDLRGQRFTSAELYALARCGIAVILLGGAQELNDARINQHEWAAVLRRPVTIGEVASAVENLLAR